MTQHAGTPAGTLAWGPRPPWQRRLRRAVAALLVVLVAVALVRRWDEVGPLLARLSLPAVLASLLAAAAGMLCSFLAWRGLLTGLGHHLPLAGGMRVWFLGNLAKYVPGSVWQAVAQAELGREYRVARRTSGAALVVSMLVALGTGALVALATLPLLGPDGLDRYWWVLLVLPVAAVVLWPPLLNRLIGRVLRLARREPLPVPVALGGLLRAAGWDLAGWLCFGTHVWLLAESLGATDPTLFLQATGAFAAAWCIGFLVVFAPAGAGARELALVLLLQPAVPTTTAWVLAGVSRLLFTVGDAGWGVGALLAERRRRRRHPGPDAGAS
jgi:hypothetical protein